MATAAPARSDELVSLVRALIRQSHELLRAIQASCPPIDESTFIPNPLQEAVLAALDGKALRTDALVNKTDSSSGQMFKNPGGIPELRAHGLVAHHRRIGFYRPDAPPPIVKQVLGW